MKSIIFEKGRLPEKISVRNLSMSVSNVAAAICYHPYRTAIDVLEKAWRCQRPDTYLYFDSQKLSSMQQRECMRPTHRNQAKIFQTPDKVWYDGAPYRKDIDFRCGSEPSLQPPDRTLLQTLDITNQGFAIPRCREKTARYNGIVRERDAIEIVQSILAQKISRMSRTYSAMLNCGVLLNGRIDGLIEQDSVNQNKIIEIKTRSHRIANEFLLQDRIQIQAYMSLLKVDQSILCEGIWTDREVTMRLSWIDYSEQLWSHINDRLSKFWEMYHYITTDEGNSYRYFQLSRHERETRLQEYIRQSRY